MLFIIVTIILVGAIIFAVFTVVAVMWHQRRISQDAKCAQSSKKNNAPSTKTLYGLASQRTTMKAPSPSLSANSEEAPTPDRVSEKLRLQRSTKNFNRSVHFVEALSGAVGQFKASCRAGKVPPGFSASVPPNYKGMLRRFYKTHNEKKLWDTDNILKEFKRKEALLFRVASKKYGAPNYLLQFRSPMDRSSNPFSDAPTANGIKTLDLDKIVLLVERMLNAQEEFRNGGKPWQIDVGFHYTDPGSLQSIETLGLLNRKERKSHGIAVPHNGSKYGEGVYTSDPQAFHDYGSVGLIVARLKGVPMECNIAEKGYTNGNTCITSKGIPSLVVLEKGFQVVPLVQYPMNVFATSEEGLKYLNALQRKLQDLLNLHFNLLRPQVAPARPPITTRPAVNLGVHSILDRQNTGMGLDIV